MKNPGTPFRLEMRANSLFSNEENHQAQREEGAGEGSR